MIYETKVLTRSPVPQASAGQDKVKWRHYSGEYKDHFSTKATWEQLRTVNPKVWWHKIVWFSHAIPRHSFITWPAIRDRLSTRARMRTWGLNHACLLCGEVDETRDHLFMASPYSFTIWNWLCCGLPGRRIPRLGDHSSVHYSAEHWDDSLLHRLALQAIVYGIWRERNNRRHQQPPRSVLLLTRTIDKDMQNRLQAIYHGDESRLTEVTQRWSRSTSIPS
ncbi:unnamed protein product [Arabis nemorensis]|uniref:Reverse transcriptase zinc-binding domain-containing protein n=1 Tax=Arabis nemorensis TaxID=586526 RepID=A0A565CS68_9BRAS|nr:unnamed protein product [Arabis nemorensis]